MQQPLIVEQLPLLFLIAGNVSAYKSNFSLGVHENFSRFDAIYVDRNIEHATLKSSCGEKKLLAKIRIITPTPAEQTRRRRKSWENHKVASRCRWCLIILKRSSRFHQHRVQNKQMIINRLAKSSFSVRKSSDWFTSEIAFSFAAHWINLFIDLSNWKVTCVLPLPLKKSRWW